MTTRNRAMAALALLCSLPAAAVETPHYEVPYLGGGVSLLNPDAARASDAVSGGLAFFGGWPLDANSSVELRLIDQEMRRNVDNEPNYQTSLFADYVYDFGTTVRGGGGLRRGTKLFVLAGLGLIQEDAFGEEGNHFGASVGGGALVPLGFYGLGLRLEGRAQAEMNDELCDAAAVQAGFCEKEADLFVDYFFSASVQVPLTIFFEKPKPVADAADCPIAVVDPDAPARQDCVADSDRDGVADHADQCPGSSPGAPVDTKGCAR